MNAFPDEISKLKEAMMLYNPTNGTFRLENGEEHKFTVEVVKEKTGLSDESDT